MVSNVLTACWAYIKRRAAILVFGLMYSTFNVPKQMWGSLAAHRDGVGYFADPLGKPPLLTYWKTLVESSYSFLLLWSKPPTGDALLAAGGHAPTITSASSSEWANDGVTVIDKGIYLEFTPPAEDVPAGGGGGEAPGSNRPLVGVVILPGALVSPTAYAPLARSMAQRGHPTFIVRFDFNLATDGWERVGEIIPKKLSETAAAAAAAAGAGEETEEGEGEKSESCLATTRTPTKWVLAGHSMGTMAIEKFYPENPESVHGVVYMGSGNRIGDAMKGADVPAIVLRGSRDPYCPAEALEKSAHKLPKDAETIVIEGGNHRGFGSYGWQPLDWEATISLEEQRRLVVDALTGFIARKVVPAN